jgi:hypothetical protein
MVTERVAEAVRLAFGASDERAAVEALSAYDGRESERVHLAALKLAQGDLERLRHNVQVARTDYRDVLYWAEYPEA